MGTSSLINHDSSEVAVRSWSNLPRSYGYEMSTLSTHGAFQSYWSYCADDVFSLIQEEGSLKWPRRLPSCAKANFIPSPSIPNITRNGWKSNKSIIGVYHCVFHVIPHLYFETFGGFTKVRDLKPSQTIASNKLS